MGKKKKKMSASEKRRAFKNRDKATAASAMFMPCPKNNYEHTDQVYARTIRVTVNIDEQKILQRYDIYRCQCNGKYHYNRLIGGHFHGPDPKYAREQGFAKTGFTIFGQKKAHSGGR